MGKVDGVTIPLNFGTCEHLDKKVKLNTAIFIFTGVAFFNVPFTVI